MAISAGSAGWVHHTTQMRAISVQLIEATRIIQDLRSQASDLGGLIREADVDGASI
jgi:hypothetical protein